MTKLVVLALVLVLSPLTARGDGAPAVETSGFSDATGALSDSILLWESRCKEEESSGVTLDEWNSLIEMGATEEGIYRAASRLSSDDCKGLGFQESLISVGVLPLSTPDEKPRRSFPVAYRVPTVDYRTPTTVGDSWNKQSIRWSIDCAGFGSSGGIILGGFGVPTLVAGILYMDQRGSLGLSEDAGSAAIFMGGCFLTTLGILFIVRSIELRQRLLLSSDY